YVIHALELPGHWHAVHVYVPDRQKYADAPAGTPVKRLLYHFHHSPVGRRNDHRGVGRRNALRITKEIAYERRQHEKDGAHHIPPQRDRDQTQHQRRRRKLVPVGNHCRPWPTQNSRLHCTTVSTLAPGKEPDSTIPFLRRPSGFRSRRARATPCA